jgi:repressor LexA
MKTDLTERQEKVLGFLKSYAKRHGYPPTFREIGEHFGFQWAASRMHLKAMEKKGFIKMTPSKSRGIEILGPRLSEGLMLPVVSRIRAGKPNFAKEAIDSHLLVDKTLFPSEDSFSLRITGDSMIDAGIIDGDFVVVRPQNAIKNGEIGVVLLGEEAAVRRVFKDRGKMRLKPENRDMKPETFSSDEVTIIGKVIGVIRQL